MSTAELMAEARELAESGDLDPSTLEDYIIRLADALEAAEGERDRLEGVLQDQAGECQRHREEVQAERDALADALEAAEGESDERIAAWDRIVKHPVFKPCFTEERPLILSMMARLDALEAGEAERFAHTPTE